MAEAVARETPGQSDIAEGVSGSERPDARVTGIPLAVLAHVEPGEQALRKDSPRRALAPVIYWNIGEEIEYTTRDGETRVSKPMLLRYSNVFNLSQTEGIDLPESALRLMTLKEGFSRLEPRESETEVPWSAVLLVQDDSQKGLVNFNFAVVLNET